MGFLGTRFSLRRRRNLSLTLVFRVTLVPCTPSCHGPGNHSYLASPDRGMIYRPVTARAQEGPYRDICVSMDTLSLQISLRYMLGHTHRQTRSRSRGCLLITINWFIRASWAHQGNTQAVLPGSKQKILLTFSK